MQEIDTKNPIVVLGTGRSGTSVTAGMLFYMGVHMGNEFIPADQNNATGHWEDTLFTGLNRDRIIGKLSHDDWESQVRDAIALRQQEAKEKGTRWGWKIPATSNLLAEYLDIFKSLEIKADWIVCRRPKEDVIQSCLKAYGGAREQWEQLEGVRTEMITKHLLDNTEEEVRVLDLHELIEQPATIAGTLAKDLGLNATDDQKIFASELVNDVPKGAKVMIAVPNMGHIHSELALRLVEWSALAHSMGTTIAVYAPRNLAPVDHARNQCVKTFLETDFTHLWFIDADTIPPSFALKAMLKANKPVVTGVTPTFKIHKGDKHPKSTPMVFAFDHGAEKVEGETPLKSVEGVGTQRIDACGASCLMIRREVAEQMQKPLFRFRFNDQGFPVQGEDLYFCSGLRDANIPLYCNFDVVNYHHKEITL